eukprot:3418932-Ditylum_brightwellii.AAC.1
MVDNNMNTPLTDKQNYRKKTVVPQRHKEIIAISKLIYINELCNKIPGRNDNITEIWDSLSKITTALKEEKDKEKEDRFIKEAQDE